MSSTDRELLYFMARVADQAERHADVISIIKNIITIGPLTAEERNLLSVAYKALTGNRRTALRTVNAFLEDPSVQPQTERISKLQELKTKLTKELDDYCKEIVELVDAKLLPSATEPAHRVFYEKLKADYYRYSVEFKEGNERKDGSVKAKESYKAAMDIAEAQLSKANPQFLGLALNYSVFLYEIDSQKTEAISLADKTFKNAVDGLEDLPEDEYSEATLILQLLKDSVQLWTDEQAPNDAPAN
uniref:14-3-3 protein n=1 Tax=Coptotermes formosanus TaxID=36987 RepID=L0ATI8_COPFO|nr:14-3-3 protein [Coptotermes formosanus]